MHKTTYNKVTNVVTLLSKTERIIQEPHSYSLICSRIAIRNKRSFIIIRYKTQRPRRNEKHFKVYDILLIDITKYIVI